MKLILLLTFSILSSFSFCQSKKVELFDLLKKLVHDSTLYSEGGDWSVGSPSAYPIKWKSDEIKMSDDMKINFFRNGTANISVNGITYNNSNKPIVWNLMLKGPRMGFTSFTIESAYHKDIKAKTTIDKLFGNKQYTYKLLKDCSAGSSSGFYYYLVQIPKKVKAWMKVSWNCNAGNCKISLDCYDYWSTQYADLDCPK